MRRVLPTTHQPPPAPLVGALVQAGISLETALAMDDIKAEEVLRLLDHPLQRRRARPVGGRPRPAWE